MRDGLGIGGIDTNVHTDEGGKCLLELLHVIVSVSTRSSSML